MNKRLVAGLILVAAGQALIVIHWLPASYYYFPLVWYGYALTLDGLLATAGRDSLLRSHRVAFLTMIPLSAGFWWLFELFNQAVHNWRYVGAGAFTGVAYVAYASLCFSTVLPAVWETATVVAAIADNGGIGPRSSRPAGRLDTVAEVLGFLRGSKTGGARPAGRLLIAVFSLGVACIVVPVIVPHYAFPLIWASLFLLLDPINAWMGRPSLIVEVISGRCRLAVVFGIAGLICGFFWEFWNYWAVIRWVYAVPYVSQLHLFEMPLPGYLGYLPFGLEAFAATVFAGTLSRLIIGRINRGGNAVPVISTRG